MAEFTWFPSYPASRPVKPKVLKAQFGDGYESRTGDGLNPISRTWNLQFNNRLKAEIEAIDAFLMARAGSESFDWTPPLGGAGKWVCEAWEPTLTQPVFHSMSATFREVFEP